MNESVRVFWEHCCKQRPEWAGAPIPEAWAFGGDAASADRLGSRVVAGTKTATCGALWEYEYDGEALPTVGQLAIILRRVR